MNQKPKKCCFPHCMECIYVDCRYDRLEVEDYTESNKRDYFLHEDSTGKKLHKKYDKEYQYGRDIAYQRRNRKYVDRHEYNQKYYAEHGEEIKRKNRDNYDKKKNTIKCRKYRKKHKDDIKEYKRMYYQEHKEEIKRKALERYYQKKEEVS